ncbi:hypothetical protein I3842_13G103500 [Carya illinoinensis]|uniref:Uncharacterized protein n=1 Tax=Carya illinoinensis TaxID=32201 RepID=A0A922ALQ2_CARIL|nr:hypothetical protein I3842_13G103500 [Carya illinoinensis]KAG6681647.1 hypothetical protein I3842_13G103500 [Carya illinoinensis]
MKFMYMTCVNTSEFVILFNQGARVMTNLFLACARNLRTGKLATFARREATSRLYFQVFKHAHVLYAVFPQ